MNLRLVGVWLELFTHSMTDRIYNSLIFIFLNEIPFDQSCSEIRPLVCLPNSGKDLNPELATKVFQFSLFKSSVAVRTPFK